MSEKYDIEIRLNRYLGNRTNIKQVVLTNTHTSPYSIIAVFNREENGWFKCTYSILQLSHIRPNNPENHFTGLDMDAIISEAYSQLGIGQGCLVVGVATYYMSEEELSPFSEICIGDNVYVRRSQGTWSGPKQKDSNITSNITTQGILHLIDEEIDNGMVVSKIQSIKISPPKE